MLQWALMFFPSYVLFTFEVYPILCSSELWNSSYPVLQQAMRCCLVSFNWVVKLFPSYAAAFCDDLPPFVSASSEVFSHALFHWGVKFFPSCVLRYEVLSSAVPISCEVFVIQFSSELQSQDSVVIILTCKVRSSQFVCLSVCLCWW